MGHIIVWPKITMEFEKFVWSESSSEIKYGEHWDFMWSLLNTEDDDLWSEESKTRIYCRNFLMTKNHGRKSFQCFKIGLRIGMMIANGTIDQELHSFKIKKVEALGGDI